MDICVVGTGYVGLVTGAGLAELGNQVICVDVDSTKLTSINEGKIPFYEDGLEKILVKNQQNGRICFTTNLAEAVQSSKVLIVAVGTPEKAGGEPDLSQIIDLTEELTHLIGEYKIIAIKSTAPVGTDELIATILEKQGNKKHVNFDIAFIPEFLREGSAVRDFFHPSRIVIGVDNIEVGNVLSQLFSSLQAPILLTTPVTAQMIKYAANAFLTSRISFINEVANICDEVGADILEVVKGISYDRRLGEGYLQPGIGFGGPCLPKDLVALIKMAENHGYEANYLKSILQTNENQTRVVVNKVKEALGGSLEGKIIGVLGLTFKAGTSDVRNSLSLKILRLLQMEGAKIKAYDPQGMEEASKIINDVIMVQDPYQAAESDVLLILTGWEEFKSLDFKKIKGTLKTPHIIDGVNLLNPEHLKSLGFTYRGIGR
ncbi:MAG: UDP-glucose/GDP-mannose dehydrogenase family protein [Desulfobacteraceae bacterium]|nr:UDP-glucose/GDP-mannose dehydrogenase family protein [Desulfobacteraceae bacterium]